MNILFAVIAFSSLLACTAEPNETAQNIKKEIIAPAEPKPEKKTPVKEPAPEQVKQQSNEVKEEKTTSPAPKKKIEKKVTAKKEPVKTTKPKAKPKPKPKPVEKPKVIFPQTEHNFGFINEGDTVRHTFRFLNDGKSPLEILDVQVSCGCTVPVYPLEPILPGRLGKIDITFLSKGKVGSQRATIDVETNAENPLQTLTLTGVIR